MRKKVIIIMAVILLVVFGVFLFFVFYKPKNEENAVVPTPSVTPEALVSSVYTTIYKNESAEIKKKLNYPSVSISTDSFSKQTLPVYKFLSMGETEVKELLGATKVEKTSQISLAAFFKSSRSSFSQDYVTYLNQVFGLPPSLGFSSKLVDSNFINQNEAGISDPTKEGELINVYTYRIFLNNYLVTNSGGGITITIEEDAYSGKTKVFVPNFFPKAKPQTNIVEVLGNSGNFNLFISESDQLSSLMRTNAEYKFKITDFELPDSGDSTIIYIVTNGGLIPYYGKKGLLKEDIFPPLENRIFYFINLL